MGTVGVIVGVGVAIFSWAAQAEAQTAPPATPPPSAETTPAEPPAAPPTEPREAPSAESPPDVVQLRDGSLYRGTIAEYVAGSHVIILTPLGQRRIEAAQVRYAGPASQMPAGPPAAEAPSSRPASPPPEEPKPDVVEIQFDSPTKASLHVWSYAPFDRVGGERPFESKDLLCKAPCTIKVPKGTYQFALKGERPHLEPVEGSVALKKDTRLLGRYDDRSGARAAGWAILGLSALMGTVVYVVGSANADSELQVTGLVGGIAGVGIGLALGLNFDDATLVVRKK